LIKIANTCSKLPEIYQSSQKVEQNRQKGSEIEEKWNNKIGPRLKLCNLGPGSTGFCCKEVTSLDGVNLIFTRCPFSWISSGRKVSRCVILPTSKLPTVKMSTSNL
jgi:hypothetical protein